MVIDNVLLTFILHTILSCHIFFYHRNFFIIFSIYKSPATKRQWKRILICKYDPCLARLAANWDRLSSPYSPDYRHIQTARIHDVYICKLKGGKYFSLILWLILVQVPSLLISVMVAAARNYSIVLSWNRRRRFQG